MHEDPSSQSIESDEEEDEEEEILGTDDDEQEDPHDYCKGVYFSKLQNNRSYFNSKIPSKSEESDIMTTLLTTQLNDSTSFITPRINTCLKQNRLLKS